MVRELIGPELKAAGFRRARNRFARGADGGWQIIDFQASQFGSRDQVGFTLNLGTAVDGLPRQGSWDDAKPPSENACHLRERIGYLVDGQHDLWWDFDASTDAAELSDELLTILRTVAVPWLERRATLAHVLDLAVRRPDELGWHDLRRLPKLLGDAGHGEASTAVQSEADRRERHS